MSNAHKIQAARCPQCQTAFRIVPDQLKISEGWVRCGNCKHVFNATDSTIESELNTAPDNHQTPSTDHTSEVPEQVQPDPEDTPQELDEAEIPTQEVQAHIIQKIDSAESFFENSLLNDFHIGWTEPQIIQEAQQAYIPFSSADAQAQDAAKVPFRDSIFYFGDTIFAESATQTSPEHPFLSSTQSPAPTQLEASHLSLDSILQDDDELHLSVEQVETPAAPHEAEPIIADAPPIPDAPSFEEDVDPLKARMDPDSWEDLANEIPEAPEEQVADEPAKKTFSSAPVIPSNQWISIPTAVQERAPATNTPAATSTPNAMQQKIDEVESAFLASEILASDTFMPDSTRSAEEALHRRKQKKRRKNSSTSRIDTQQTATTQQTVNSETRRTSTLRKDSLLAPDQPPRKKQTLLKLFGFILFIALALQAIFFFRNQIVNVAPSTRPLLVSLCVPFGCQVGYPTDISVLSIDASSFEAIEGDRYRVELLVRNRGNATVATPWVELSLNNASGIAVVRKTFSPQELGVSKEAIAPQEELWLRQEVRIATPNITGNNYSFVLFFP